MGEAELQEEKNQLIIHAVIHFYGDAASNELSEMVASDIALHWNQADASIIIRRKLFKVHFDITGIFNNSLTPEIVFQNTDPRNNYFRIEEYAHGDISFVDGL